MGVSFTLRGVSHCILGLRVRFQDIYKTRLNDAVCRSAMVVGKWNRLTKTSLAAREAPL